VANFFTLVDLQRSRFAGTAEQGEFEDYVAFYVAGEFVLDGNGANIYDADALATREHEIVGRKVGGSGSLAFFNPPYVALLFAPLALLSLATAGLVLLLINLALLIVTGVVIHRQLRITSRRVSAVYWLAVLSFEPALYVVGQGQLSMFLIWGFMGFFIFQRQGRPIHSGAALALLLVKPQSAILAVLILAWKRQWQPLAAFASVAAVLVMISLAVSGPSVLWRYPEFLIESTGWDGTHGVYTQHMYGWNGFMSTIFAKDSLAYIAATVLCIGATVGAVFYVLRDRWRPSSSDFPFAMGVLALGTLLINPHAYLHDVALTGVILGFAFMACKANHLTSSGVLYLGAAAFLWLLLSRTLWLQYELNLNLVTPLLAALLVLLVRDSRRLASTATRDVPKSPMYAVTDGQPARGSAA
jgi:hypothetical protein